MENFFGQQDMSLVHCDSCNLDFSIPAWLVAKRREDGQSFFCPNGHELYFGDSEVSKLKKRIEQLELNLKYYKQRVVELNGQIKLWRARAAGYKGQYTKLKRRVDGPNMEERGT